MRDNPLQQIVRAGLLAPAVLLCLVSGTLQAEETHSRTSLLTPDALKVTDSKSLGPSASSPPFPLVLDRDAGLDFDLGGSETQKLQLQLNQPLSLHSGTHARVLDNGSNLLGLDATLNVPVADNFSLAAGVERQLGNSRFQSLGSIQCMNGVLRADSYTASGCRFINEPLASTDRQTFGLGARMDFSNASASVNWFNRDYELSQSPLAGISRPAGAAALGGGLLSPSLANPLVAGYNSDPMQYLNSETSGVDLNFKVGIATNNSGDIQLGLAFTQVLEAEFQGLYANGFEALSWTVAEPFNSARMNLDWNRGSFSTGVQGFYRESVDFLDRNSIDGLTTFDVHFTWRAPWNADLTVGASNILNAGGDNAANVENQPIDPLESIYGRIPYVRYKQDL
jgi:hypothetical protein